MGRDDIEDRKLGRAEETKMGNGGNGETEKRGMGETEVTDEDAEGGSEGRKLGDVDRGRRRGKIMGHGFTRI